ncbi:MAG: transporter substrate-binding domain-containing protein [Verrucomicrobia bacterium]|nr:transporter substrate-binding domain-containing protein [Verrucomicrobiota bacterium]MBV8277039.1 transporter substrate-binding domain-containing protein [Verrucomicrobiota bacterium]
MSQNRTPGRNRCYLILALGLALSGALPKNTIAETVVNRIKQANRVAGTVNVRAGLASLSTGNAWVGLAVDLTRGLSAAILQDPDKAVFAAGDRKTGPEMVRAGAADLYIPVEPIAPTKLTELNLATSYPFFFNVQRVLVRKDSGFTTLSQLIHTQIIVQPGYVNEQNIEIANEEHLRNYFVRAGWQPTILAIEEWGETESAFTSGHVKAMSAEETELAGLRLANRQKVGDAVMLPEIIGMVPVSAVMRADDPGWLTLVNATISVLIKAEELGITSENIDYNKSSKDPEVRYLLGVSGGIGKPVGLDDQWAERVIKAVGNYGQAFERDLGANSGLAIERGLNQSWRHGGLLYPMPIQ